MTLYISPYKKPINPSILLQLLAYHFDLSVPIRACLIPMYLCPSSQGFPLFLKLLEIISSLRWCCRLGGGQGGRDRAPLHMSLLFYFSCGFKVSASLVCTRHCRFTDNCC